MSTDTGSKAEDIGEAGGIQAMNFCPRCGTKLSVEGLKFCPECGTNLQTNVSSAQAPAVSSTPEQEIAGAFELLMSELF